MSEKYYITWEDFHQDVKELAVKIKSTGEYNKIIAISRGGLLPAGILAYELDIRNSQAINISSYDNDAFNPNNDVVRRSDEDVEIDCQIGDADDKTLVVDDLSDSGRTFRIMRKLLPAATFVAVYSKEAGKNVVDICTRQVPDKWIVFPWDI